MSRPLHTFTGKTVDHLNPKIRDIKIEDIAHSLACQCRYTGHTRVFYSVAEHCVRLSLLPATMTVVLGRKGPAWLLMHDAAEAYLGDIACPLKELLPKYEYFEDVYMKLIKERFSLPDLTPEQSRHLHLLDKRMQSTEVRDIMTPHPDWATYGDPEPFDDIEQTRIEPWPWQEAETIFLNCARNLNLLEI